MTHKEIARRIGVETKTVYDVIRRIKRRLHVTGGAVELLSAYLASQDQ